MLTPIEEMTTEEFDSLPDNVRYQYPPIEKGARPSNTNYYECRLMNHLDKGNRISQRVWDGLDDAMKDHILYFHKLENIIQK